MIRAIWKYHKTVAVLSVLSIMGIVVYFASFDAPLLNSKWNLELVNKYFELLMNISLSILISCIIFIITAFLPIYEDTNKYMKTHLSIIKELRAFMYHIIEPIGRHYNIAMESSLKVYIDHSDLYDLRVIRDHIDENFKKDYLLNYNLDQFVRHEMSPIKFYNDTNKQLRNIEYMKEYVDNFNEKVNRFHSYCNRSLYYFEVAQILVDIQENYFLRSIDPESMVENSTQFEYLPRMIDSILLLDELIIQLQDNIKK